MAPWISPLIIKWNRPFVTMTPFQRPGPLGFQTGQLGWDHKRRLAVMRRWTITIRAATKLPPSVVWKKRILRVPGNLRMQLHGLSRVRFLVPSRPRPPHAEYARLWSLLSLIPSVCPSLVPVTSTDTMLSPGGQDAGNHVGQRFDLGDEPTTRHLHVSFCNGFRTSNSQTGCRLRSSERAGAN